MAFNPRPFALRGNDPRSAMPKVVRWASICLSVALCLAENPAAAEEPAPAAGIEPPQVTKQIPAHYPESELDARHEATVVLLVTIGRDGTVTDVDVAESAGTAFDDAAVQALGAWRFAPALRDGQPVPSRIRVPFRFELPVEGEKSLAAPPAEGQLAPTFGTPGAGPPAPAHPAKPALEVTITGEREVRTETRSTGDFRVERGVLRAAPRKDGTDVLGTAPGLYVGRPESPAVAPSYSLRGFDAEHGQDIEFRVGGIPINQPSHVHGQGYADLGFLIAETVDELRVSEGVYDPRQGDFAVAGSIDVDLGVDGDERGVQLKTGYGSFKTFRQLVLWAPRDEDRRTFGAANVTSTDGYGENREGQAVSAIVQHRFGGGPVRFRVLGIAHGSRSNLAGVVRADDVATGRVCFHCVYPYPTARDQNATSSRGLVGLFAEQRGSHGSNAEVGIWFDQSSFRLRENISGFYENGAGGAAGPGDRFEQQNQAQTLGLTARYRTAPYHPHRSAHGTVEVGADARLDQIEQGSQTWDERVDADVHGVDIGIWGDLDWHFARVVRARLGARADALSYDIDDRTGNAAPVSAPDDELPVGARRSAFGVAFGPRTSAEVRPLEWLSLLLAYGEGYRSQQARTLEDGEETPFTKVRSADVGARFDWGPPLRLSVGGFFTHLSDDVVFHPEEGHLERTGASRRVGATARLSSRASFLVESLSFTFVDARLLEPPPPTEHEPQPSFTEGEKVPFVPPVVVRADLGTEHTLSEPVGLGKLRARTGFGLSFLGSRPLPYGDTAKPVLLVDASIGAGWGPLSITLEGYNLLDDDDATAEYNFPSHWDPSAPRSDTPARHLAAGAPRSWMLTLGATL